MRDLPPDLQDDYAALEGALVPWLDRGVVGSNEGIFAALKRYGLLVHERAASLALIAKGDRSHLFTRHILDSLNPVSLFDRPPATLLDIGAGAGFPGIPLAIVWPETRVILLEARDKKAGFLEGAIRSLALTNVRVVCARLEDYGRTWHEAPAAAMTIRALGNLPELLEGAAPAAQPGASWVYFLGNRRAEEALGRVGTNAFPSIAMIGAFGGRLLSGRFGEAAK